MTDKHYATLQREMSAQISAGDLLERSLAYGSEYLSNAHARSVAPGEDAQKALAMFREPLPTSTGDAAKIIDELHALGSPATVAQTGGRFFGLVNGGCIPASLAARLLADVWDQNAVLHATSPTAAALESVCEAWLKELFGLPESTVAGFVTGTSIAIVLGLAAARWRICARRGYDVNARGLAGAPPLRIVTGRHAHSTVIKAVALLGLGTANIEWAEVDEQGRLLPETLPELDDSCIVILQAGNVNSGAFDPLRTVGGAARDSGAWVHIDGAFGLWAAAAAATRHLADGLELADSWSVDGHKTLNTPYDNGIALCRDAEALTGALENSGAYIMYSQERDSSRYTPELSRRARGVELWAALKYLGRDGIDALVTHLHARARQFSEELSAAGFAILNDVVFNQVLVEIGNQETTDAFVLRVRASGEAWVGASAWFGKPVVRISVCSWATTPDDVSRTVAAFEAARKSQETV
ncbi:MAG: aminotransferase class V-fold PLP-dependent enzyme [Pseudomonadota bacterium]